MLQKWYMWKVISCPYPQCQLDISRFYIILVKLGIQQTNNVKNRVTSCGSSGGGDARLAVTSQWQRPCRPSLCSWPSLTWWLGFSAGLRAVGTSHHTGGLPGRLLRSTRGRHMTRGGFVNPNNVPSSLFNPGNSLQLLPPNRWEGHVWKCVCLCVCRYPLTTLNTFIILI